MSRRPRLALAMRQEGTRFVMPAEQFERIAELCDVLDPEPLERFDDDRAWALLAEIDILITGWGCPAIDADILATAPHLRLIAHAAGSVKGFISPLVLDRGIRLTHAAIANALPVAEFTLAVILLANKHVDRFARLYRQDRNRDRVKELADQPIGNLGAVVGLVSASRIGRRVIELLKPFDLELLLHDPFVSVGEAQALGVRNVPLDELMARADIVSLHAPSIPSTRHMIDAPKLALMRDDTTLINTARGAIVDHAALEKELVSGRIKAVIDVTEPEVLPATSPLYDLPNVLLTPHIAGAVGHERRRLGEIAISEVMRYLRGDPLLYEIDAGMWERIA